MLGPWDPGVSAVGAEAVGGPLAAVQDGDLIELDAHAGRLDLPVDER